MSAERASKDRRLGPLSTPERNHAIDRLHCDQSKTHDTEMQWELRGGLRTGRLIAVCRTCHRRVPTQPHAPPPDTSEFKMRIHNQKRWHDIKGRRSA